jgi:hypothetical protein
MVRQPQMAHWPLPFGRGQPGQPSNPGAGETRSGSSVGGKDATLAYPDMRASLPVLCRFRQALLAELAQPAGAIRRCIRWPERARPAAAGRWRPSAGRSRAPPRWYAWPHDRRRRAGWGRQRGDAWGLWQPGRQCSGRRRWGRRGRAACAWVCRLGTASGRSVHRVPCLLLTKSFPTFEPSGSAVRTPTGTRRRGGWFPVSKYPGPERGGSL